MLSFFTSNIDNANLPAVAAGMLVTNWLSMHSASAEPDGSRGFTGLMSTQSASSGVKAFGESNETGSEIVEKPSPIKRVVSKQQTT